MGCQGYAPLHTSSPQDAVLDQALARGRPGAAVVLDLDGCLYDNRPRQVAIIHEHAGLADEPALYAVQVAHFADWDLRRTLANAGVDPARIDAVYPALRQHWWRRFFHGDSVGLDHAMPGAVRFVRALAGTGAHVVYLTGRDRTMHQGTAAALRRWGFPDPDQAGATLLTKPDPATADEDWKAMALPRLASLGEPVLFLDNEPTNVNLFAEAFPAALVVFVSTDHSPRPTRPAPQIPWIRGFLRTTD